MSLMVVDAAVTENSEEKQAVSLTNEETPHNISVFAIFKKVFFLKSFPVPCPGVLNDVLMLTCFCTPTPLDLGDGPFSVLRLYHHYWNISCCNCGCPAHWGRRW